MAALVLFKLSGQLALADNTQHLHACLFVEPALAAELAVCC
jgi:hypothetical protein